MSSQLAKALTGLVSETSRRRESGHSRLPIAMTSGHVSGLQQTLATMSSVPSVATGLLLGEARRRKNPRILCASANFSGPLAQVVSGWMVRG